MLKTALYLEIIESRPSKWTEVMSKQTFDNIADATEVAKTMARREKAKVTVRGRTGRCHYMIDGR